MNELNTKLNEVNEQLTSLQNQIHNIYFENVDFDIKDLYFEDIEQIMNDFNETHLKTEMKTVVYLKDKINDDEEDAYVAYVDFNVDFEVFVLKIEYKVDVINDEIEEDAQISYEIENDELNEFGSFYFSSPKIEFFDDAVDNVFYELQKKYDIESEIFAQIKNI
jgi:hypothetical protein